LGVQGESRGEEADRREDENADLTQGPRTTPTIASNGPTLALIVLVTGLIIWLLNNDDATAMVERLARAGMARLSLAQEVS
jgi:hypothetical protein